MTCLCACLFPALQRTLSVASWTPGDVNRIKEVTESAGGKAVNTARVLKQLGVSPRLIGFCGGATGRKIKAILDREAIPFVPVDVDTPSRIAQTILPDDGSAFTELVEDSLPLSMEAWERFHTTFRGYLADETVQFTVMAGTLPDHASMDTYARMVQASRTGMPTLLDTSGKALRDSLKTGPSWIKVNHRELLQSVDPTSTTDGRIEDVMTSYAQQLLVAGAERLGVTQGRHDGWLWTRHQRWRFTLPTINVVSTLGCGDAVNAGIAFAHLQGREPENAFSFGLACGLSNAMHRLPGMVDPKEVEVLAKRIIMTPF